MRAYFVAQLRAVFESSPSIDSSFRTRVSTFLDSLELFIDLLLSLRDIPETPEWKHERSTGIYRLMQFTQKIGRIDLYVRFIHQLVGVAVESGDWISAGLALKSHADCYTWGVGGLVDGIEVGKVVLPPQSVFSRKEALLYHAIDHLGQS
jgi:dedicator of cytokinesis protein 3